MLHNSEKDFIKRHIGPSEEDQSKMLKKLNYKSLDDLIDNTVPEKILFKGELNIGESNSEYEALRKLKAISKKNQIYSNFIGMGYYGTYTPYVILRNILENPGWYTSYTPYQPEVAQGRLEMLLNFQQMIVDFTGMDIANASLLDEGTAAAEAMGLSYRLDKGDSNLVFVSENCHPQTIEVIKTRAEPMGLKVLVGNEDNAGALELFMGGTCLLVSEARMVSLAGSTTDNAIIRSKNGVETLLPSGQSACLDAGAELFVPPLRHTNTVIIAVEGGFDLPPLYGSVATSANAVLVVTLSTFPVDAAETEPNCRRVRQKTPSFYHYSKYFFLKKNSGLRSCNKL